MWVGLASWSVGQSSLGLRRMRTSMLLMSRMLWLLRRRRMSWIARLSSRGVARLCASCLGGRLGAGMGGSGIINCGVILLLS